MRFTNEFLLKCFTYEFFLTHFARFLSFNSAKIHFEFAEIQCSITRNYDLARTHYLKAAQILPSSEELWFKSAHLLHYHMRENSEAERCYQQCLSRNPVHVRALIHYGFLLCNALQRHMSAKKLLARALQLQPDDADAKFGMSVVELIQMGINNDKLLSDCRGAP